MATVTAADALAAEAALAPAPTFLSQLRMFLWLASGLFSMSSLALAFLDYFVAGSPSQATTHFVAALAAAGLFGSATLLEFGPEEA